VLKVWETTGEEGVGDSICVRKGHGLIVSDDETVDWVSFISFR
jgi:hypothetical protein